VLSLDESAVYVTCHNSDTAVAIDAVDHLFVGRNPTSVRDR